MLYVEEEEENILTEIKKNRHRKQEIPLKYLIILLLAGITLMPFCTNLEALKPDYLLRRFFPGTWKCSRCGYENFDGISNCDMCGKGRNM